MERLVVEPRSGRLNPHMPGGAVTFNDMVVEALTRFSDREALVDGDPRVTYRQAADRVFRIVAVLYPGGC